MITPKYTARIDTLWMCAGKCGVAIGAAYWPLLLIHGVIASCEQRVGHKRKRVPSPACVLAVSMSNNAQCYR